MAMGVWLGEISPREKGGSSWKKAVSFGRMGERER
jgi:hypothetical protein